MKTTSENHRRDAQIKMGQMKQEESTGANNRTIGGRAQTMERESELTPSGKRWDKGVIRTFTDVDMTVGFEDAENISEKDLGETSGLGGQQVHLVDARR